MSKAIMFEGLMYMARKDAVRKGDGPAMVDNWQMSIPFLWDRIHPHYMTNGHYMLSCKLL